MTRTTDQLFTDGLVLDSRILVVEGLLGIAPPAFAVVSSAVGSVPENSGFSMALVANRTGATWTKNGGADTALFTITGNILSMTGKNFESPADANTDNAYIVIARATNPADSATVDKTVTVTVTDIAEGGAFDPLTLVGATGSRLTPVTTVSDMVTTSNSQRISGLQINGTLTINHTGVTVTDCIIDAQGADYGVYCNAVSGFLCEFNTISNAAVAGVRLNHGSVNRCEIFACRNACDMNDNSSTFIENYAHNFLVVSGQDNYGVRAFGINGINIVRNYINMDLIPMATIDISDLAGTLADNIVVDGNYLRGGDTTVILGNIASQARCSFTRNQIFTGFSGYYSTSSTAAGSVDFPQGSWGAGNVVT